MEWTHSDYRTSIRWKIILAIKRGKAFGSSVCYAQWAERPNVAGVKEK